MQSRVARRNLQGYSFRDIRSCADRLQLQLPWLCPARLAASPSWTRCIATGSSSGLADGGNGRRPMSVPRVTGLSRPRPMATAVADHQPFDDDYNPFEPPTPQPAARDTLRESWETSRKSSNFEPWAQTSPIIIADPWTSSPFKPSLQWKQAALTQEVAHMFTLVDACLRVDRLERAAALLRRLRGILQSDNAQLAMAHNAYVVAFVPRITESRREEELQALQKWFELELKEAGVQADATTYALMLKASLHVLQGPKLARTIRRYVDLAVADGLQTALLNSPVLSAMDLHHITRVCPTDYNALPEQEAEAEDSLETSVLERITADSMPKQASTVAVTGSDLDIDQTSESSRDPRSELPRLRGVVQKGSGLTSLRKSIALLYEDSVEYPHDLIGTQADKDREFAMRRQQKLERESVMVAVDRWRQESLHLAKMGIHTPLVRRSVAALLWEWHVALKAAVEEELKLVEQQKPKERGATWTKAESDRAVYGPFLRLLSAEKLSAIAVTETITGVFVRGEAASQRLTILVRKIGEAAYKEYAQQTVREWHAESAKRRGVVAERARRFARLPKRGSPTDVVADQPMSADHAPSQQQGRERPLPPAQWPLSIRMQVGSVLMSALLRTATVTVPRIPEGWEQPGPVEEQPLQVVPALSHTRQFSKGKDVGMVVVHDALVQMLMKQPHGSYLAKHLPMLVPPNSWKSFEEGPYLEYSIGATRDHACPTVRQHVETAIERGDLAQVFAALDVLSKTPWRINRAVFAVMTEAWNSGQEFGKIAPESPTANLPPEPDPATADDEQRRRWRIACYHERSRIAGLHSVRCHQNMQLEVARAYLDEVFYLPHNMDFRGRAYPTPPYLNQMGADHIRGLMIFAEGKPLGEAGLDWLKIHLANVFGHDKASFQERLDFVTDHVADIRDSAQQPLAGRRWWLEAEDPWQCLASCMELTNALDSPDPRAFVSHLPVHQDGTCNGLQHYAALGGDSSGAREVNLEPGERPADIYTAVARLVEQSIKEDLTAQEHHPMAEFLQDKIKRKIVKQTVMTNVYGVTRFGAARQVLKHLLEAVPELPAGSGLSYGHLAAYLSRKILAALSNMFGGAHLIQHWLCACAGRIANSVAPEQVERALRECEERSVKPTPASSLGKANGRRELKKALRPELLQYQSAVVWTTPLKLPVAQPYAERPTRYITTHLQRMSIREIRATDPVDRRKQVTAFPPNFVHSLDAAHMMLSALRCNEAGLTFASVHDSYWTHAADVDSMNEMLRGAFISIHRENVMARLAEEFALRYKGYLYLAKLSRNSHVARKIQSMRKSGSQYSYQGGYPTNELITEYKRQRLLNSDDEAEREEGRRMVTPASIVEKNRDALELNNKNILVDQLPGYCTTPTAAESILGELGDDTEAEKLDPASVDAAIPGRGHAGEDPLEDTLEFGLDSFGDSTAPTTAPRFDHMPDLEAAPDANGMESAESADAPNPQPSLIMEEGAFGTADKSAPKPKAEGFLQVWLPLTFPPVPKKGSFDVERLRESRYFFC